MLVSRVICQTNWNTRFYVVFQSIISHGMTSNGIAITPSHPPTVQAGQYEVLWGHSVFRIQ